METMCGTLQLRASNHPDDVCYAYLEALDEESNLDARQLDLAATRMGGELLRHARPGDRVLLLLPSGLEFVRAFWACLYAGLIAVPLYPPKANDKSGKIKHIVQDCRPTVAIVREEPAPELVRELAAGDVRFTTLASLDSSAPVERELPAVDANGIAFLQYSSGSTGDPKGAMISHRNILANLGVLEVETRSSRQDVFVSWLPLFHDMGMVLSILMPMYVGARSILFSPLKFAKNPLFWIQIMSRYRGTISGAPNFAYDACAKKFSATTLGGVDLSRWRLALNGAEPVRAETLASFCRAYAPLGFEETAFMPAYGMAEATVFLCGGALLTPPRILTADRDRLQSGVFAPADGVTSKSLAVVSCGAPPAGHDIIVVNDSAEVAEGQVGEIWVRGRSICSGFWGKPDYSQALFGAFTSNGRGPYLRTGDLGFFAGGELYVLGRLKDVVIVQGRNIHPHDIEACVRASLSAGILGDAVVFGIDGAGTESLVLVLEIRPRSMEGSYESIAADLRATVFAAFGVLIDAIVFARVGAVMKTTSGKVMRRAMRDRYAENAIDALHVSLLDLSSEQYAPLATDTELRMATLWENLLGAANVHAGSNFLQLGGNSLTVARLIASIRSQWNVDLPLQRVFEHPILSTLAALVDQAAGSVDASQAIRPGPETGFAALSFQQQRLWFLAQMGEDVGANENISVAIRLVGTVDTAALQRALSTIVERHETLRTRFGWDASRNPVQSVTPAQDLKLMSIDLHARGPVDVEQALQSCIRQEVDARFDLTRDLLLRACLVRVAADEYVLLLSVHHIAADGVSLAILIKEMSTLYSAYAGGRECSLPPLRVRYRDYAEWQTTQLQNDTSAADARYWRARLTGIPAVHGLPVDRPRESSPGFRGAVVKTSIDAQTTDRFHRLCAQNAATLFMGLHAVFSVLLSRYSNETTIVVGTAVENRGRAELQDLIGLFANIVALRSDFSGDASFGDVLRLSRQTALEAYEHQAFPFEKVVGMLHPERSVAVTPLFQVMLLLQNNEYPVLDLPGVTVRSAEELETFAKFDLTLSVRESKQGLQLTWKYDASLFDAATIARLAASFSVLLEGVLGSPTSSPFALPLLGQRERHYLLHTLNATQAIFPEEKCIHELFEAQVAKTPNNTAVVYEDERLTYAELNDRANRLAHYLREAGVTADTLVGLCVERSLEMVVGLLGILKAGGAYVPLDPGYPRERLAYMIEDSGVQWLLTQEALHEKAWQWVGERVRVLSLDSAELQSRLLRCSAENPRRSADQSSRNLAYVIYTSGSTGQPKGAMNEHRAVVNRLHWMQECYALSAQDRVLQKTPFSFDVSVWEFFWTLLGGAQLIVPRPEGHKDPTYLSELIHRSGVTRVHFVPSMLQTFLEHCHSEECASLRQIVCSGEELSAGLARKCLERLPHVRLSNLYGPTETAIEVTSWECAAQDENVRIPIGRPISNIRIYILNADREPVPIGVTGEICIGGIAVGRGYLNRPELTAERFVRDPFSEDAEARMYRTGDLGRWRAD
ncbi:MAG TPA: amino acid adenylation domain-containing protein, partial [Steroidobacter sp.]|uniref:amino acid adenylation domain-containing protein n=1 Tax=Steroidobacter sp. TaxID=1978227 RepID=UPI002ED9873D